MTLILDCIAIITSCMFVTVFFGGLGFLLGISVLNFDFHWAAFTAITMVVELLMGIFVFAVFTLEVPIRWGYTSRPGVPGAVWYPADSFSDRDVSAAYFDSYSSYDSTMLHHPSQFYFQYYLNLSLTVICFALCFNMMFGTPCLL